MVPPVFTVPSTLMVSVGEVVLLSEEIVTPEGLLISETTILSGIGY